MWIMCITLDSPYSGIVKSQMQDHLQDISDISFTEVLTDPDK